jgi:DNA-directed RNA polymerase specialized sigma24 family protein
MDNRTFPHHPSGRSSVEVVRCMPDHGSISLWIPLLKEGDEAAVREIWQAYFARLVVLARAKLRGVQRRVADEEDAALCAFDSFCRGAEQGRFPQLNNRDDLWRLLVVITARKAADLVQNQARLKRGGGQVRGDSALAASPSSEVGGWAEIAGNEPTPEFAAQTAEEYCRLLGLLGDAELRSIAVLKMEGYSNAEIASRVGCAVPTIERRLRLIRKTWAAELGEPESASPEQSST